ncbi:hypothetical protein Tco_1008972, partial [Tanacetum coccineum]
MKSVYFRNEEDKRKGVEYVMIPPKTAQALLARQRERKAKSILVLAILDEYQLRFHAIKDAKALWAAIKSRFGGNVESKKMQKTVLKQQFENFSLSDTEGLDKAYDRFQKLISLLEVHGAAVPNEDANQKFLRALPSSWNNVALIMRNKDGSSRSSLNSQNVAFISVEDTSSSNEVNTANSVSTASGHNYQGQASSSSYTDDLMFSFFANQSNSLQLDDEDLEQIDHDDLEEMDLKWQVLIKLRLNALTVIDRRGLLLRECRAPRNQGNKNEDVGNYIPAKKITVLEFEVKDKSNAVTRLKNQLDETLREKDDLKAKLEQFETSSKNLNKLINSQLSSKDKTGLGYGDQLNKNDSSGSELFNSVFDSHSSDGDDNQTNDRFKKDNGYHVVPPPLTRNYMPLLADLSFAGLDDSVYRPTTNKTSASMSQVEKSTSQTSNTNVEMPRVESVMPSGVIIEDWVSDDDEDIFQSNDLQATDKPSFKRIDYSHLIKDCDFHEKRMAKKSVLKNMGKNSGQREIRPVWNNTQRINHQNKFVPSAVLTRSRRVPVSAAKQSSFRAAASTGAVKQVNTTTHTNRVNVSKLRTNAFHKSWVSKMTDVKASAGYVWRPKMTDLNNVSKDNSRSWVSKRGNPQQALKNKGIFDSGCSRHMTGNKDFL